MNVPVVLIVDDEEGIRESLTDIFTDEGYSTVTAESGEEAVRAVRERMPELVLLDIWLPGMDGLKTLEEIRKTGDPTVIMISGHGNIETAVKATRMGAYDFLEKPLSLERVVLTAKRAIDNRALEQENRTLRESLSKKWRLLGESSLLNAVREQISMAAKGRGRVLITGESGTGKEIAARMLHNLSERARMPFIEVNCAAIPGELIESELFGHEKGSFTGAFEQKKGKFELADKGTLFLDEIADMSLQTQAKLLRVLETQQFQRVGGSRNISVDVRVIAATNKDLLKKTAEEQFRDDLYFRLNVIPIEMPTLRERREDIPILVRHFTEMFASEYGQAGKTLQPDALEKLSHHDWPGNIRELRNLIERLVLMTPSDTISGEDVDLHDRAPGKDYLGVRTLKKARDAFEKDFITNKLKENNWNVSRTAEALEIERSNLHRKIKAHAIKLP
jgi:two-component system nitrogen regulation response regulator NtrX